MMTGYNFDLLESVQSYIHNLAENMGVNVEAAWATPARSFQVTTYKWVTVTTEEYHISRELFPIFVISREGGVTAQDTYNLYLYERNVQVVGLRSIDAPILIDTIRTGQESGHSIHNLLLSVHTVCCSSARRSHTECS